MATSSIHKNFSIASDKEVEKLIELSEQSKNTHVNPVYSIEKLHQEEKKLVQKFFR